jgi:hypothetical protein
MSSISPTTGEPFYSGDWEKHIRPLVKALSVGAGKLNTVAQADVERQQEQTDRLIDNKLQGLYVVPLSRYRVYNRTGHTFVLTYPGRVQEAARYLVAGLLMKAEYQQLDSNVNEAVQNYIDYGMTVLEDLRAMTDRLEGQELRPDISAFLPGGIMPYTRPEPPAIR